MKTSTLITIDLWLGILAIVFSFLGPSEGLLVAGAVFFSGGVIAKASHEQKVG